MSEWDAVLFANEVFYRAFSDKDIAAMEGIWSEADDISCIHPGWPPLFGRDEVMHSWQSILANSQSPQIEPKDAQAFIRDEVAYVICYESIDGEHLIATNVFRHETGSAGGRPQWRLLHHQAGPTTGEPDDGDEQGPNQPLN